MTTTIPPLPPAAGQPGEPADPPPAQNPPVPPAAPAGPDDTRRIWAAVIVMVLVLGSALTMLLAGQSLQEALGLAAGMTLLGISIARRALAAAGPLPSIVVAAAVTIFALVLVLRGHPIGDVALGCGLTGLVAGEIAAWFLRPTTSRQGV